MRCVLGADADPTIRAPCAGPHWHSHALCVGRGRRPDDPCAVRRAALALAYAGVLRACDLRNVEKENSDGNACRAEPSGPPASRGSWVPASHTTPIVTKNMVIPTTIVVGMGVIEVSSIVRFVSGIMVRWFIGRPRCERDVPIRDCGISLTTSFNSVGGFDVVQFRRNGYQRNSKEGRPRQPLLHRLLLALPPSVLCRPSPPP